MQKRTTTTITTESTPALVRLPVGVLQRKCDCGQHTIGGGECLSCGEEREGRLQRSAISRDQVDNPVNQVPSIVHAVLNSPGQPLDANTRAFFEPRFEYDFSQVPARGIARISASGTLSVGAPNDRFEQEADQVSERVVRSRLPFASLTRSRYDFGQVRVHTDRKAAESARAINAVAYTVGNDI